MILTLHDGTQREIRVHGRIAGLRVIEVTLTLEDFIAVESLEVLTVWLMQEIYPRMVRPLAAETSSLAVEQSQRDVPAVETPQVEYSKVEEGDDEEHRGRKSKLGIPYKSGTKEYARAYYQRNRDKMNERTKKWQQENKDKVAEYQKGRREEVKEELTKIADPTPDTPRRRFEDIFGHEGAIGSGITQENPNDAQEG